MELVIFIGSGLLMLSAVMYVLGALLKMWHLVPKHIYRSENSAKRLSLEWSDTIYLEISFCKVVKYYKLEICWGW